MYNHFNILRSIKKINVPNWYNRSTTKICLSC